MDFTDYCCTARRLLDDLRMSPQTLRGFSGLTKSSSNHETDCPVFVTVAPIRWAWLCVWMACGASFALAQGPGFGGNPLSPFEAEPLPDELTVIEGLPDPAPAPPPRAVGAPLVANEVDLFGDQEEAIGLSPVRTESSGSWLRDGLTYVEADVVMLQHNSFNRIDLATDVTTGSNRALQVERGALGLATNLRINVGQNLLRDSMNRDHAVEFMFYGLGDWSAEDSVIAATDNFLTSDIDPFIGGFNGSDQQTYRYASDLDSYELNYRISWRLGRDQMVLRPGGDWVRQAAPGTLFSLLAGLRVIKIDERFNYTSVSTLPNLRRGQATTFTSNDLVGFQLGGQWMQQHSNWNWGVRGKAGAYVNFTSMTSSLQTVDPVLLEINRLDRAEEDVLAFAGELSVFARYHIRLSVPAWPTRRFGSTRLPRRRNSPFSPQPRFLMSKPGEPPPIWVSPLGLKPRGSSNGSNEIKWLDKGFS